MITASLVIGALTAVYFLVLGVIVYHQSLQGKDKSKDEEHPKRSSTATKDPSHQYPYCRCCTGEKNTVQEIYDGFKKFTDNPTGTVVVLVDGVWRDDFELYVAGGKTNSAQDKVQQKIRKVKY